MRIRASFPSSLGQLRVSRPTPVQWLRRASAIHVPTANPVAGVEKEAKVHNCYGKTVIRTALANIAAKQKEASIPCPDPSPDSQTARFVEEYAPYLVATYSRPLPVMEKGEGCYLWDMENRRYLDFTGGIAVNSLGHCDPDFTSFLAQQASQLVHCSNLYHNAWTGSFSKLLVTKTLSSGGMSSASRVFTCNSGTEANEAALKFARKVGHNRDPSGSKHELVSFTGSFHGRTLGALSATANPKYQAPFSPLIPGFKHATFNDTASTLPLITEKTCGVIVEPIQGEGGINVATPSFLTALRKKCDEVGAVLIYDEIQCGLGRSGSLWVHSHANDQPEVPHPDVLTTAKALGNGFPVGAVLVNDSVASNIVIGDHGTTFGGNPLASRIAHYCLSRLSDPELHAHVREREAQFRGHFEKLSERFPGVITEIRGRGLLLGVQLDRDPGPIVTAARERGLLIITAGRNTLRFAPPLVVSGAEVDEGMGILGEAMRVVIEQAGVKGTRGGMEEVPRA